MRLPRFSLGVSLASLLVLPAVGAPPESAPPADQDSSAEHTVIIGPVNPYGFSPKERGVTVDAQRVNLKQVLEDLGPDAIEWYQHVQTLSNPWFEGRCPGSEGHERAVSYIEWWMTQIALAPAFSADATGSIEKTYRQPFELTGREPKVVAAECAVVGKPLEAGKDFAVMGASGSGNVSASLAFVGYGIKEGKDDYTSFDNDDDIRDRIAVVLRYGPVNDDGESKWGDSRVPGTSMASKLDELVTRGAAGVIIVNPPGAKQSKAELETLRSSSRWGGRKSVPVVQLSTDAADSLVRAADPKSRDLSALRKLADVGETKDFAMRNDVPVTLHAELADVKVPAANVGGILAGKGALKDEWIVIGGHFDHVGYGKFGTDPANTGKLHPGADDNASGTAGVLVLARELRDAYAAAAPDANLRSVLFLCFSGEESGLDGSKWWVGHPTIGAAKIDAMLNMDMIGRLRSDDLSVGGVGTADGFEEKIDPLFKSSGLTVHADPTGRGPSDHASFYNGGIPVLFFFTGTHDVYHRPGDKGYAVNPAGAVKVISLVRNIALDLADDAQRLTFKSTDAGRGADRGYARVRLGVQPAMNEGEEGVKVDAVSAETSAAEAGIKAGDLLLTWNGKTLGGAADMMTRLQEHQPGDKVTIVLRRDGKEQEVVVTLKASRRQE